MHETVKRVKTPEQALASLMMLCAKAERSTGDARRLMCRWGVDKVDQQQVLEKLVDDRFIDDSRYAAAYVREKSNLSGWGIYKISAALSAKGVARDTIADALSQLDKAAMKERLSTMLSRKLKSIKGKNVYDIRAKLIRYGLSLGYEYDSVTHVAEIVTQEESQG